MIERRAAEAASLSKSVQTHTRTRSRAVRGMRASNRPRRRKSRFRWRRAASTLLGGEEEEAAVVVSLEIPLCVRPLVVVVGGDAPPKCTLMLLSGPEVVDAAAAVAAYV